ncbi:ABC transporter ATP-binding protein [Clostridium felsineum]|uniref:ABC transporter ATP-binding protein n=1 Tax=Clostridium felsineum TaxID=36839 RepID=UPI00098C91D9|nr:ABC transporter ATP-binding protein [Clostridium felsineum]URZ18436.1 ABC transporter ATP-binding protein YtrB [Clostridium felsineum DSM 794]
MISIKGVSKTIENKEILKNISLEVKEGNIFGLIGPNGAGKTTLIKCLTAIYKTDSGEVKILEGEVFDNPNIKKHIGYVADQNDYFSYFNINNLIKFYRMTYEDFNMKKFEELNKIFNIPKASSVKKLSKGMKMKLALMLNLSIMPKVLILDEPTGGLDPIAKRQVTNIILDEVATRKTTVFISSHNLSSIERICDEIGILINGEMVYKNSIEKMKKEIRKVQVVFKDKVPENMESLPGVLKVEKVGRVYNIITNRYNDAFVKKLDECNIVFREEVGMNLEDMFIYSVGGDMRYEEVLK